MRFILALLFTVVAAHSIVKRDAATTTEDPTLSPTATDADPSLKDADLAALDMMLACSLPDSEHIRLSELHFNENNTVAETYLVLYNTHCAKTDEIEEVNPEDIPPEPSTTGYPTDSDLPTSTEPSSLETSLASSEEQRNFTSSSSEEPNSSSEEAKTSATVESMSASSSSEESSELQPTSSEELNPVSSNSSSSSSEDSSSASSSSGSNSSSSEEAMSASHQSSSSSEESGELKLTSSEERDPDLTWEDLNPVADDWNFHDLTPAEEVILPSQTVLDSLHKCILTEEELEKLGKSADSDPRDWTYLQLYIDFCNLAPPPPPTPTDDLPSSTLPSSTDLPTTPAANLQ